MRMKDGESPPTEHDRVSEPGRRFQDEPRHFESAASATAQNDDTGPTDFDMDDPDINTHGSER
jgi:hypothetical protein